MAIPVMPPHSDDSNSLLPQQIRSSRVYGYGPIGFHPVYPFFEPLVLVAGLAFLAFLVQTIHALYATHNMSTRQPSLVGGVVSSLVPTATVRDINSSADKYQDIIRAIRVYEILNGEKEITGNSEHRQSSKETANPLSTVLIPIEQSPSQRETVVAKNDILRHTNGRYF